MVVISGVAVAEIVVVVVSAVVVVVEVVVAEIVVVVVSVVVVVVVEVIVAEIVVVLVAIVVVELAVETYELLVSILESLFSVKIGMSGVDLFKDDIVGLVVNVIKMDVVEDGLVVLGDVIFRVVYGNVFVDMVPGLDGALIVVSNKLLSFKRKVSTLGMSTQFDEQSNQVINLV